MLGPAVTARQASPLSFILDICSLIRPFLPTRSFGIFQTINDGVIQKPYLLRQQDFPAQVIEEWGKEVYEDESRRPKWIVMAVNFVPAMDSLNMPADDDALLEIYFIQCVYHVIMTKDFPLLTVHEAVDLSGIQLNVKFYGHDDNEWVPGFLRNRIVEFAPKRLMNRRRDDEWETSILARAKATEKAEPLILRAKYLEMAKRTQKKADDAVEAPTPATPGAVTVTPGVSPPKRGRLHLNPGDVTGRVERIVPDTPLASAANSSSMATFWPGCDRINICLYNDKTGRKWLQFWLNAPGCMPDTRIDATATDCGKDVFYPSRQGQMDR